MSILDKKHILTINLDDSSIEYSNKIKFYNTDKNISNLYVKIKKTNNDGVTVDLTETDLTGLTLKLAAIKPKTNQFREITGVLTKELEEYTCAIYKFELSSEFTNQVGIVHAQFNLSDGLENGEDVTIDPFAYEIKASKLTGLNAEIISNPDLPVLKQLIKEVQKANYIDDENISKFNAYSNEKVENILANYKAGVNSQISRIENGLEDVATNKVDKEDGKGLSSNDFTDDYKTKVDNSALSSSIGNLAELSTLNKSELVGAINELYQMLNQQYVEAQSLIMSNNLLKTLVNEQYNLIPVFNPMTTENTSLVWSSSDTSIATVTNEGLVTTKGLGQCSVTAVNMKSGLSCSCEVQVLEKLYDGEPVETSITISGWSQKDTDWIGQDATTNDFVITCDYIPIKDNFVELTCPQGMIWSYIFFYNGKKPLTNKAQGTIASNVATTAGTIKKFAVPASATHFRITACDITYNLNKAFELVRSLTAKQIYVDDDAYTFFDKFKSNDVILNTRNVILHSNRTTYQLEAVETPVGAINGITYSSSDDSIATVDNTGLITAKKIGKCCITVKNNKGTSQKCNVSVIDVVNTGQSFTTIPGADDTERLKNAIEQYEEVTGNNGTYSIGNTNITAISSDVTIRNATFVGVENKSRLTISTNNVRTITFDNCVFDNVGIFFSQFIGGTIILRNCIVQNWKYSPFAIESEGVSLEFYNTIFRDAQPDETEWTTNDGWIRFSGYTPVEISTNNVSVTADGCSFINIMARCVIHWQSGHSGGVINFTNNTVYRTEGHGINMESACSGNISYNHFSFMGALRGAFGEASLEGEDLYFPGCFGVGGNAVFAYPDAAPYSDITVTHNVVRYAMENGIEGGYKEVAYNYVEYTGYRDKENYTNYSMEGIWGSAKYGVHHNIIINPQMDGVRVQNYGLAGNDPCNIQHNIILWNDDAPPKDFLNNSGVSIVCTEETGNKNVTVKGNTIIGFANITKIDGSNPVNFNLQEKSEYAY